MSTLLGILRYPLAHQIGWALLHSLWQGALVGAVFALLRFGLRRRSANARYLAGCLSLGLLLATLVLPLLSGPTPSLVPDLRPSGMSNIAGAAMPAFNLGGRQSSYAGNAPHTLWHGGMAFLGQLAPLLTAAWLLGVAFFSARLTRGCWWVRNIRIRDNELLEVAWMEMLNDLRRRLRVSRPVGLLKSALVEVPTVIGWLRPVILVPAATLSGLTPRQLEAILAHELAHVRRHDYVVNAFQCLVETLMFYHPVAWWISRCIREERENCCDDLVIEVCGDRLNYARALAAMEGLRGELPELAFAATGGSLLNRIRRLLGVSRESAAVSVWQLSGMALLGIGLLLIVLGVRLALSTPTYSSTVRIRVEHNQGNAAGWGDQRGSPDYDPYFIQTEFEVIQSEIILGKVIEDLNLNKEWGARYAGGDRLKNSQAVALLKTRLQIRLVRGTSLIEIRACSDRANEAAIIANDIAQTYVDYRHTQSQQLILNGIRTLEQSFAEQEARVKRAQQGVDKLRLELNISDMAASAEGPTPQDGVDTLQKLEALRVESKAEYTRQATLLAQLKRLRTELGPEGMAQAIPTAVPDTVLSAFLEKLGNAEQQLASVSKEFGPEHSEVTKVKSQIEDLRSKINARADGIILGLDAKVHSLSNGLDYLSQELAQANSNDIARAASARPYFEAKRNLEEMQRFQQMLGVKIANENAQTVVPKTALVEIVDRAIPSLRPSSPNLPLALALIALGILLDIAGLLVLKGGPRMDSKPIPA